MVRAIIASVDEEKAPKRLLLGSDAYTMIHQALTERLAALEAQKGLAFFNRLYRSVRRLKKNGSRMLHRRDFVSRSSDWSLLECTGQ
jgi:hypothetical protein